LLFSKPQIDKDIVTLNDVTTLMNANTFHELVIEEFAAKYALTHKGNEKLK
jgi:hypothetical protein